VQYQQDSLARLRAQLGEGRFDRAYGTGMALPADEALRAALGQNAQPDWPGTY
jgi:hypothetical protein